MKNMLQTIKDDLTMYLNDSSQDAPQDAQADEKDVDKDFTLVLPLAEKALGADNDLAMAHADFNSAVADYADTKLFKENMNNAINNVGLMLIDA